MFLFRHSTLVPKAHLLCVCVCVAIWGQESLRFLETDFVFISESISGTEFFQMSQCCNILPNHITSSADYAVGGGMFFFFLHVALDCCAATTSCTNLNLPLFFYQGVLSSAPIKPCKTYVSQFCFSSLLSLKLFLIQFEQL